MKKIKEALQNKSLREKLFLSSILCVLLPLIFSFLLMNRLVQDELVRNSAQQSRDALEILDMQMTDYFDDLLYLSNYIQFNDRLKTILLRTIERTEQGQTTTELNALDDIEIARDLEAVTNLLVPTYLSIIIGQEYAYTNYPYIKDDAAAWNELFAQIMAKPKYGIRWIGVHPNYIEAQKEKHPYVISIAGAVELTKKHKAIHLISVHKSEIRKLLDEIVSDDRQEIMLVDANGIVVSHNNQDLTQKVFPYYEEIKEGASHHVVQYDEKEHVLVSQPSTYGDWNIVSLILQKTAVGNISNVMRNTLVALISFFLLFLLLLILLASLLTNPLKILNKVIEQVKNGNLRVRYSGLTGHGDIEQLGESLDTMMDTVEQKIEEIKIVEKSKRKAELEMLQAQINPHFLFNTLNSLRLKISLNGDQESSKIIQSLSKLLRMTFNRKEEFVTLQQEIEVVRHYLKLMNFKSNSKIELDEELEQDTMNFKVPTFFLQPLIENSILHGFDHKSGTITISSRYEGNGLIVCVADNGKGLSTEALQLFSNQLLIKDSIEEAKRNKSSFTGIGIGNVFQRMRLIFGNQFRMEIENNPAGGTQIMFFIPGHYEV